MLAQVVVAVAEWDQKVGILGHAIAELAEYIGVQAFGFAALKRIAHVRAYRGRELRQHRQLHDINVRHTLRRKGAKFGRSRAGDDGGGGGGWAAACADDQT